MVKVVPKYLKGETLVIVIGGYEGDHPWWGGTAPLGAACLGYKDYNWVRTIFDKGPDTAYSAQTIAHEIGHFIGMHDENSGHLMGSSRGAVGWSVSSRQYFENHYLNYKKRWCMPEVKLEEDTCKVVYLGCFKDNPEGKFKGIPAKGSILDNKNIIR